MIDYIQFTDPSSVRPADIVAKEVSHIVFLPAIRGRRFDFKPGLNVIVGPNASGKTSLLSAIRQLYFAETVEGHVECYSKDIFQQFFNLSFTRHFDQGLFEFVEMKADFSKPLFSLRKDDDMGLHNIGDSAFNLVQFLDSSKLSSGQSVSYSLHALIAAMQGRMPGTRTREYMNFRNILSRISEATTKAYGNNPAEWAVEGRRQTEFVMEWFKRNDIGARKHLTAVLDEPDEGMDIYRLNSLLALLRAVASLQRDQFIVSLHNVALVNALAGGKGVNVIEMIPGYLQAMLEFGGPDGAIDNPLEAQSEEDVTDEVEEFRERQRKSRRAAREKNSQLVRREQDEASVADNKDDNDYQEYWIADPERDVLKARTTYLTN